MSSFASKLMQPSARLRAAIYCRISDDREGLALGVVRQEEDCTAHCERNDWEIRFVLTDNDISASTRSTKKRPDYEKLLHLAYTNEIDIIVSYSNGRLTRRPLELEGLITLHEKTGTLISTIVSGQDDLSTADGRMTARIKAAVDAAEAEKIGERVKRTLLQRRMQGKPSGGSRVFGYIHPTEENGYHYLEMIDPIAAVAIRDALKMALSGSKPNHVMKKWQVDGIRTPYGNEWKNHSNVKRALCNPKIAGLVASDGEIVGPGDWPAIITPEERQALLACWGTKADGKSRARKYLLAGVAYCLCGSKMYSQVWKPEQSNGYNRYICLKDRGGCGKASRYRPWLEEAMKEYVAGRIEAEYSGSEIPEDDTNALIEVRIREINAAIGRIMDAVAANVFTLEEAASRTIPLREEIQRLRSQQGDIAREAAMSSVDLEERLEIWLSDEPDTFPQRYQILTEYVSRIIIAPLPKQGKHDEIPLSSMQIVPVEKHGSS